MGHEERKIIDKVLIKGTKKGRLFRVNAGSGWVGEIIKKVKNFITLQNPRPFHGMPAGTPDIIGWESTTLCKLMENVGVHYPCQHDDDCKKCGLNRKIAIFKAVEVKTGNLKLSEKQENWKRQLLNDGGIYEQVRE